MPQYFSINDPPGCFKVFGTDGSVRFDSRLQTMRVVQTGTLDMPGRTTTVVRQDNNFFNTIVSTSVTLSKTYAKAPYVRTVSRRFGTDPDPETVYKPADRFYPPYLSFGSAPAGSAYTSIHGHYSNVNTTTLTLGNSDYTGGGLDGSRRFWFAIFDNPADQS